MKTIVCVKQVPKVSELKVDKKTNTFIREGVESIVNPSDIYALEEAIRLKEKYGWKVTVLSMGPIQCETALRECLSYGADEAVLLCDKAFAGADSLATSVSLAKAIQKIGMHSAIMVGKQSIDGNTAQVGPQIAELLDIPHITNVSKIEQFERDFVILYKQMEYGTVKLSSSVPLVIGVENQLNTPRFPKIKDRIRAKKVAIDVWDIKSLGLNINDVGLSGSPTSVINVFREKQESKVMKMIGNDADSCVDELMKLLQRQCVSLGE